MTPPIHVGLAQHLIKRVGSAVSHIEVTKFWCLVTFLVVYL